MPVPFAERFSLVPALAISLPQPARSEPAHVLGNGLAMLERTETRTWSSGRKNGLAGWQNAKCWELPERTSSPVPDMGPYDPERALLSQLIVAREPTGNLDQPPSDGGQVRRASSVRAWSHLGPASPGIVLRRSENDGDPTGFSTEGNRH
ncbi:MAG TPA: hypothetical protein VEA99_07850 [Gemmatimonadaceae bacterium]|nr:hypothetical protein [Gemmatimonadaceae bacterium]